MNRTVSRRSFLKKSAVSVFGFSVLPSYLALGKVETLEVNPQSRRGDVVGIDPHAASGDEAVNRSQDKPNIILFISDDHGWQDSGCYGDGDVHTPNIDRLAKEGMRFMHGFAASPLCSPSRSVIATGMMPHRSGAHKFGAPIKRDLRTMSQYMKELGYHTAHVGKLHVSPLQKFPYDDVIDRYAIPRGNKYESKAPAFIREYDRKEPLFLVVCTHPPHTPWKKNTTYDPATLDLPPNFVDTPETRSDRANYYTDVTLMDKIVGEVLDAVKEKGMADNTLFVYTTDQGAQWPFAKWCVYDGGLRVPLIARWPGKVEAGSVSDAMLCLVDLLPTFMEACGGNPPAELDGRSFLAVLAGDKKTHREVVFGSHTGNDGAAGIANYCPARTIRTRTHRYILNLQPGTQFDTHITGCVDGTSYWKTWVERAKTDSKAREIVLRYQHRPAEELYDLDADPWEMRNLVGKPEHAELLKDLRERLAVWCRQQGDDLAVERLAELGAKGGREGGAGAASGSAARSC